MANNKPKANASQETGVAVNSSGQSLAAFAGFQFVQDDGSIQFLNGVPVDYRADCRGTSGFFMLNNTSNEGPELRMRVINYQLHEQVEIADVFGVEDVVEVLFVDDNNAIASVIFRTFSKDNFLKMMQTLMLKKTPPATQIITAKLESKTTNKNTYFIAEFSAENSTPEAVTALKDFFDIAPEAFTAFRDFSEKE